jgi:hypothetical protein
MRPISLRFVLALGFAGCAAGTGHVDVAVATSGITGDPPASADRLVVTIDEVDVHVEGGDGWVTVFAGAEEIDLYDVNATATFLGSAEVPAGDVTQVRLVLDGSPSLEIDGVLHEVACPSCTQTGIKIVTGGKLQVASGERLALELTFDPASSLVGENGSYRLNPVIKVEEN